MDPDDPSRHRWKIQILVITSDHRSSRSKGEDYEQWEQEDLIIFSWLIQNIEPVLVGNLTEYPIAKMLWDALVVTYSSERDKLQTFNLHVKANDIKQNNSSLEDFWISLQGFLNALDRRYEPIKREILRLEPLPSLEAAYATVRKEAAHQNILGTTINETQGIAAGHTKEGCFRLVGYPDWWTNGHKKGTKNSGPEKGKAPITVSTKENANTTDHKNLTGFRGMATASIYSEEDDGPFSMNTGTGGERPYVLKPPSYLPDISHRYFLNVSKRTLEDSEMLKNTSFIYFIKESFKNCKRGSIIGGMANIVQNPSMKRESSWIFNCGATDTMTYDLSDFATLTKPTKSYIDTVNVENMVVKNGGTIEISPTIKLSNCLNVPALSHKLLSISHVTKELNCSVLMQPTFCILQDIRTGAIIGRGTEIKGLYYVDEVTQNGAVMLSYETAEREA
ncbi:hypothetical protein Tco_0639953 [Tanacetum coccineum]